MGAGAKVILDSISPAGDRLLTLETTIWRPLLAEKNTHRSHSRSSASSRAIPIRKQLDRVMRDPAMPVYWNAEQAGMQSGASLESEDLEWAQGLFSDLFEHTHYTIEQYLLRIKQKYGNLPEEFNPHTLHKSLLARLLEPYMWHTAIFAATDAGWMNFFQQRASKFSDGAQGEFRDMADACWECWETSTPTLIERGEWHMPYLRDDDNQDIDAFDPGMYGEEHLRAGIKRKISVARCARVSYLNHDGIKSIEDDLNVYNKLVSGNPIHWAPLEFVATPGADHRRHLGNFDGWDQMRHRVQNGLL